MPVVLEVTDVWAARRSRVAALRATHAFALQILDFYGALVGVQEDAFKDAEAGSPPADGIAEYVAERVVPRIVDVGTAAGPDRLRADLLEQSGASHANDVVRRWMRGDDQTAADRFVARASLGPVLEALGPEAKERCEGPRDGRHCPACGGPPQLSFSVAAGEDLATGRRFLRCARCDAAWGFARMRCAGCGEDSATKLNVFGEVGTTSGERGSVVRGLPGDVPRTEHRPVFPHMRIEACDTCRRYLLGIDCSIDPAAVPSVDELVAVPLDLFARERGYTKITPNLMGF